MKVKHLAVFRKLIFLMAGMLPIQVLTGAMRALCKTYVDEIILRYINMKRKEMKLPSNHPALLLFDDFKAQYKVLRAVYLVYTFGLDILI